MRPDVDNPLAGRAYVQCDHLRDRPARQHQPGPSRLQPHQPRPHHTAPPAPTRTIDRPTRAARRQVFTLSTPTAAAHACLVATEDGRYTTIQHGTRLWDTAEHVAELWETA